MPDFLSIRTTAFRGMDLVTQGPLAQVALTVKAMAANDSGASFLTFDDASGAVIDLDLRGGEADVLRRLAERGSGTPAEAGPGSETAQKGRGRPKLGVVSREVTLLPRHWQWLAQQPGGASQALRRLVDEARVGGAANDRRRAAQDAAYRFMSAMTGNLADFEEASRALFAGDRVRFEAHVGGWPRGVRDYALTLASPALTATEPEAR